uniref:Uncharacterized protein n=1 Tax=Panagrolaimus superbus TaxID=310955 RepID=A0A914Z9Q7_9BILA
MFEGEEINNLLDVLPALEHVQFNLENPSKLEANDLTVDCSSILLDVLNVKKNLISNVTIFVHPSSVDGNIKKVHKKSFKGYSYDGTKPEYHCYHKTQRYYEKPGEILFKILVSK